MLARVQLKYIKGGKKKKRNSAIQGEFGSSREKASQIS